MKTRKTGVSILIFAAALVLKAAIGPVTAEEQTKPTPAPSPVPTKSPVIPPSEKSRKNPIPNVPEAVESGRGLFASQCAMCHGLKADGRGDLARDLKLQVPDLTDPQRQGRRTDGEWFYIIGHGHLDMPAEKRLVDQNKWEMILYLRSLVRAAPAK